MAGKVVIEIDVDNINIKVIDKGLKNVWKWEWLEWKVEDEPVRRFIRKINVRGLARCELCSKDINYGGRGWKSLEQHLKKKIYHDNFKTGLLARLNKNKGHYKG